MESEAPQSGTIGGLPAAKRELRRMIRGLSLIHISEPTRH